MPAAVLHQHLEGEWSEERDRCRALSRLCADAFPSVRCSIIATDVDDAVLARAQEGCYPRGSLRELPEQLLHQGFEQRDGLYCVRQAHRHGVSFLHQDLRSEAPAGLFDLILCRNVAFTYFGPRVQGNVLDRLVEKLTVPGYLVVGAREKLPREVPGLVPLPGTPEIFGYDGMRVNDRTP